MISKSQIKFIEKIDSNYVIGGSNATMIYIGYEIRKCDDIDLHLTKIVDESLFKKLGNVDIFYDSIPCIVYKEIRLIKLEKLIANKFNRLYVDTRSKDLYDLYFLLDLDYNIDELKEYVNKSQNIIDINNDFSSFIETVNYKISINDCISKIKEFEREVGLNE